ncbi:MAG: DUF1569 domain-containing protein [Sumerlaeia bacterium]
MGKFFQVQILPIFNRIPLNRCTAPLFEERIRQLHAEAPPQFGSLTSHRMIAHLEATFRVSLGTTPCEDISNALLRTAPMRWLVINVLPLPKGKMKAPTALTPEPVVPFEESRKALLEQLWAFVKAVEAEPCRRTLDPWLGMITLREWSKIHATHLDHHLKQFAV